MKENTSSNLILRALEAVRRDPVLAELVTNVGQLVSARAAQKDFVVNYVATVTAGLHRFSQQHLRGYIDKVLKRPHVAVVLSYQTSLSDFDQAKRRITDWKADPLTPGSENMAAQLSSFLAREWVSGAGQRTDFQIHSLAQQRVRERTGVFVRVPVYITSKTTAPAWIDVESRATDLLRPTSEAGDVAFVEVDATSKETVAKSLGAFTQSWKKLAQGDTYVGHEDIANYAPYLQGLIDGTAGECTGFVTTAISDELSNVPLGTLMLFSREPIDPSIVLSLQHLSFDLFGALYKTEQESVIRHNLTALMVTWMYQEAADWSERLRDAVRTLRDKNAAQAGLKPLEALAETAAAPIELFMQIVGVSATGVAIELFRRMVEATFESVNLPLNRKLVIEGLPAIPRYLALICLALIRFASRLIVEDPAKNPSIDVRLERIGEKLALRIESSPHYEDADLEGALRIMNYPYRQAKDVEILPGARLDLRLIWHVLLMKDGRIERAVAKDGSMTVEVTAPIE